MIDFIPGNQIEQKSLAIIEQEVGSHSFDQNEWPIVRRMIHATADFSILSLIRFANEPVRKGIKALQRGASIVVDSNMIKSGISTSRLEKIHVNYSDHHKGDNILCRISEKDIHEQADLHHLPRAVFSMRSLKNKIDKGIVCIGNSPMALWEVVRLIQEESVRPELLIAMPVGFVNVSETKELLKRLRMPIPYIMIEGRRGGSTLAASAMNAMAIMALDERGI